VDADPARRAGLLDRALPEAVLRNHGTAPIHRLVYEQVVPVLRQTGAKVDLPDPVEIPARKAPVHAGAEGGHGAAE